MSASPRSQTSWKDGSVLHEGLKEVKEAEEDGRLRAGDGGRCLGSAAWTVVLFLLLSVARCARVLAAATAAFLLPTRACHLSALPLLALVCCSFSRAAPRSCLSPALLCPVSGAAFALFGCLLWRVLHLSGSHLAGYLLVPLHIACRMRKCLSLRGSTLTEGGWTHLTAACGCGFSTYAGGSWQEEARAFGISSVPRLAFLFLSISRGAAALFAYGLIAAARLPSCAWQRRSRAPSLPYAGAQS